MGFLLLVDLTFNFDLSVSYRIRIPIFFCLVHMFIFNFKNIDNMIRANNSFYYNAIEHNDEDIRQMMTQIGALSSKDIHCLLQVLQVPFNAPQAVPQLAGRPFQLLLRHRLGVTLQF